jgi:zinc transporter ZupT
VEESLGTSPAIVTGSGHSGTAVLLALCLGDFMHNFTDGVVIGAAFKLCSPAVAWGIVAGTCAHEVRFSRSPP